MTVRTPTFVLCLGVALMGFAPAAWAEEGVSTATRSGLGMWALAIALGLGLAALGGTLGQSRAISAALEGIARNPNAADKIFVPMIIGLSLIESLVLVVWVLMYLMMGKI